MNVQYAIKDGIVYVLEVNPRASRTVPYVSKATGVPLPKIAVGLMWGRKMKDYGLPAGKLSVSQDFVKSPVFPFNKFPGVDPALGPEMRSTGETRYCTALRNAGLTCKTVFKVNEGRPNVVDLLKAGSIQLAVYTTAGAPAFFDEKAIRRSAVQYRVPCITTMSGARAAADAVAARLRDPIRVWSLQEIHESKETVA
jgi:carbamoyl-phosphate synthase large subunit